jgi:AraC-like DNA-binding protein
MARKSVKVVVNVESQIQAALRRIGADVPEVAVLFDFTGDTLFWIKDKPGRYQWVNLAFVFNFGLRERDELVGRTDFDMCSPALANQYRMDDERVLQGTPLAARAELIGRFDHTLRWFMTSKIPLYDSRRQVVGTAGISHPVSQTARDDAVDGSLSRAVLYMSEHCDQTTSNTLLAKLCGISVRTFERQFLVTYGLPPHEYLRQLRVRMSCRLLVFSKRSITEIAGQLGFADQSHFTKEFKRLYGETPNSYRERHQ